MKHKKDSKKTIKKDKKHHHFFLKICIVLIVLIILFFKFGNLAQNSEQHKLAKEYFKTHETNATIQEFMHPRMIAKEFEIEREDFDKIIGVKLHPKDYTRPLGETCKTKKINCEDIISKLNAISRRDENVKENNGKKEIKSKGE